MSADVTAPGYTVGAYGPVARPWWIGLGNDTREQWTTGEDAARSAPDEPAEHDRALRVEVVADDGSRPLGVVGVRIERTGDDTTDAKRAIMLAASLLGARARNVERPA